MRSVRERSSWPRTAPMARDISCTAMASTRTECARRTAASRVASSPRARAVPSPVGADMGVGHRGGAVGNGEPWGSGGAGRVESEDPPRSDAAMPPSPAPAPPAVTLPPAVSARLTLRSPPPPPITEATSPGELSPSTSTPHPCCPQKKSSSSSQARAWPGPRAAATSAALIAPPPSRWSTSSAATAREKSRGDTACIWPIHCVGGRQGGRGQSEVGQRGGGA
eukprot:scaffold22458_cov124-Isochrysis_galbana.AAC.5